MTKVFNSLPKTLKGGDVIDVLLSPFGKFSNVRIGADGKREKFDQVCDEEAFDALVANFKGEVLWDYDHESEDGGSTRAVAWITALRVDAERGLIGTARFTPNGAKVISARELRFPSPAWETDANGRPVVLASVGLTNRPNLPVPPVLNSKPAQGADKQTQNKDPQNMDSKQLAAALGLPDTATDEEIMAALADALKRRDDAEAKLAEAESKAAEAEAEAIANSLPHLIKDKKAFVKGYAANREVAAELLKALNTAAPSATSARVLNAAAASKPTNTAPVKNRLEEYDAMPAGKEKRQFFKNNAIEINKLRNEQKEDK